MNNSEIQIGLPCVYEQLCFWIGVGFATLIVGFIVAMIISAWRDKTSEQKRRFKLRKRNSKNNKTQP